MYFYIQTWKRIFRFSSYLLVSKLSSFAFDPLVRFFISAYFNPLAVSYFVVPTKLLSSIAILFNKISEVFYPASANAYANGKIIEFKKIFLSSYKTSIILIIPIYLMMTIFSKQILSLWIGSEFAEQAWLIMTVLSFYYMIASITTMIWNIALGHGLSKISAICSSFALVIIALFILPLSIIFGISGPSFAIALSSLNGIYAIFYVTRKIFNITPKSLIKELINAPLIKIILPKIN